MIFQSFKEQRLAEEARLRKIKEAADLKAAELLAEQAARDANVREYAALKQDWVKKANQAHSHLSKTSTRAPYRIVELPNGSFRPEKLEFRQARFPKEIGLSTLRSNPPSFEATSGYDVYRESFSAHPTVFSTKEKAEYWLARKADPENFTTYYDVSPLKERKNVNEARTT